MSVSAAIGFPGNYNYFFPWEEYKDKKRPFTRFMASASSNVATAWNTATTKQTYSNLFTTKNAVSFGKTVAVGFALKALATTALTPLGLGAAAGVSVSLYKSIKSEWSTDRSAIQNFKSALSNWSTWKKAGIAAAFGVVGADLLFDSDIIASAANAQEAITDTIDLEAPINEQPLTAKIITHAEALTDSPDIGDAPDVEEPLAKISIEEPIETVELDKLTTPETTENLPEVSETHTPTEVEKPAEPVTEEPVAEVKPEPAEPVTEEPVAEVKPEPAEPETEEPVAEVKPEPAEPVTEEHVAEVKPEPAEPEIIINEAYTIQSGDNLWKIVKAEYGLTNNADIQRMVDFVANTNSMEGLEANGIMPGQILQLPQIDTGSFLDGDTSLKADWQALDADIADGNGPDDMWDGKQADGNAITRPIPRPTVLSPAA